MIVLGIDPGTTQSAYVIWDDKKESIKDMGILENEELLDNLYDNFNWKWDESVIEMIASYGMPVGQTTFETCVWIGRFYEGIFYRGKRPGFLYRKKIVRHFCHTNKGKDGNVSQVLRDRFGEKGTKKNPGKLYGVSKDIWQALAVAVYYSDIQSE